MTVYVFTGPTLARQDVIGELDAIVRPPVSRGDVYRVTRHGATAVGIVDGRSGEDLAVWHKEILWAMSEGVHVYGAAGVGALRAADLADFGMVGVGAVFNAYRRTQLQDDDEVALPEEAVGEGDGIHTVTMVNIRATLQRATRQGVIGPRLQRELQLIAKDLFYPERSYGRIIEIARRRSLAPPELEALSAWLTTGEVDTMRLDALAMLRRIRSDRTRLGPKQVSYTFEHTQSWEALIRSASSS